MGALQDPAFSDRFTKALACAQKGTAIRAMLKRLKFFHRDEKWWEACKLVTDYADKHVDKALQRLSEREKNKSAASETHLRLVDEVHMPHSLCFPTLADFTLDIRWRKTRKIGSLSAPTLSVSSVQLTTEQRLR